MTTFTKAWIYLKRHKIKSLLTLLVFTLINSVFLLFFQLMLATEIIEYSILQRNPPIVTAEFNPTGADLFDPYIRSHIIPLSDWQKLTSLPYVDSYEIYSLGHVYSSELNWPIVTFTEERLPSYLYRLGVFDEFIYGAKQLGYSSN